MINDSLGESAVDILRDIVITVKKKMTFSLRLTNNIAVLRLLKPLVTKMSYPLGFINRSWPG